VFIDETWAKTNMTRRYGRCRRGVRLIARFAAVSDLVTSCGRRDTSQPNGYLQGGLGPVGDAEEL